MTPYINLLTKRHFRRRALRSALQVWGVCAGLILLCMLGHAWGQQRELGYYKSQEVGLSRQFEPLKAMHGKITALKKKHHDLKQRERVILGLSNDAPLLTLLSLVSQAALQSEEAVRVGSLVYNNNTATVLDGGLNIERTLQLAGEGRDNLAIARFAAALRESICFENVELEGSQSLQPGLAYERSYRIKCDLNSGRDEVSDLTGGGE